MTDIRTLRPHTPTDISDPLSEVADAMRDVIGGRVRHDEAVMSLLAHEGVFDTWVGRYAPTHVTRRASQNGDPVELTRENAVVIARRALRAMRDDVQDHRIDPRMPDDVLYITFGHYIEYQLQPRESSSGGTCRVCANKF